MSDLLHCDMVLFSPPTGYFWLVKTKSWSKYFLNIGLLSYFYVPVLNLTLKL